MQKLIKLTYSKTDRRQVYATVTLDLRPSYCSIHSEDIHTHKQNKFCVINLKQKYKKIILVHKIKIKF